jgi:hypothetical protein
MDTPFHTQPLEEGIARTRMRERPEPMRRWQPWGQKGMQGTSPLGSHAAPPRPSWPSYQPYLAPLPTLIKVTSPLSPRWLAGVVWCEDLRIKHRCGEWTHPLAEVMNKCFDFSPEERPPLGTASPHCPEGRQSSWGGVPRAFLRSSMWPQSGFWFS